MISNLDKAKAKLNEEVAFVAVSDGRTIVSAKHGVGALLELLDKEESLEGFSVADRLVGKAAASLLVLLNAKEIYTPLASENGCSYLKAHGIPVSYEKIVPAIMNHKGDDMCPLEKCVLAIDNPEEAHQAILKRIQELRR